MFLLVSCSCAFVQGQSQRTKNIENKNIKTTKLAEFQIKLARSVNYTRQNNVSPCCPALSNL